MSLLLKQFIDRPDAEVIPKQLAIENELSEAAVLEQVRLLEKEDFVFEWENDSCKLKHYPRRLSLPYLKELSRELSIPVFIYKEVDSTNRVADHLRSEHQTPFIVGAIRQTHGRGRLGRSWYSASAKNFYFSLAFTTHSEMSKMGLFTLWMGVALTNFLRQCTGVAVTVKWPNDLYINEKKVGGMLTEARPESENKIDYIFGVGINVDSGDESFPEELTGIASTLSSEGAKIKNINEFALQWIDVVWRSSQAYLKNFDRALFHRWWDRYDMLNGRAVTVVQGSRRYRSICQGIDTSGALIIQKEDGEKEALHGGEVSLSLD